MRRTFFTLLSLIISFGLGVAVTLVFRRSSPHPQVAPPTQIVVSKCPTNSDLMARERYVVISVPSDNEFYIGKNSIALSDIPEMVRTLTANESPDVRVVFIKGEPNVKYSTINRLIIKVKEADVRRIEVVPDRRKF